jgi:hypothetical protein
MTTRKRTIGFIAAVAMLFLINQPAKADGTFEFDLGEFTNAATGDESHTSAPTGEGQQGVGANVVTDVTSKQIEVNNTSRFGLLTPGSAFGMTAIPSGQYSFGFQGGGITMFSSEGGILPPTATSSVDLSITNGW